MVIQHNNYEKYILDYLEGNLSKELVREMDSFFKKNPDLLDEAIEIQDYKISKTDFRLNESIKSSLLKENSIQPRKVLPYWKLGIAASFLALLSVTSVFLYKQYNTQQTVAVIPTNTKPVKSIQQESTVLPLNEEVQTTQQKLKLKLKQNEKQKISYEHKKQVHTKTKNKSTIPQTRRTTKRNRKIQKTIITTGNAVELNTSNLNHKEKEHILPIKEKQIIPVKKINIKLKKPSYGIDSSKILAETTTSETLTEPKRITKTSERILVKNNRLKSKHKTSLHELFTELEIEEKKETKNHKFVKKTGKLLKSVFKLEEISPKDIEQAFIPKSIKIKK